MRFNSVEYLEAYQRGRFPRIHKPMFEAVLEQARGNRILDVCCSTGLLGEHLSTVGFDVIGIERDLEAIAAAKDHGVGLDITPLSIDRSTAAEVYKLIEAAGVTIIVARRCFSELFREERDFGVDFCRGIQAAGVNELFLQGRAPTKRATHPIPNLDAEIEVCGGAFVERRRWPVGPVAYLTPKEGQP